MALVLVALATAGCTNGLEFEEVPQSIQNQVGLDESKVADVIARELFKGKVYQVNWDKYVDIILESTVGKDYQAGKDFTNKTAAPITIMGKMLAPNEKMFVRNTIESVYEAGAPEDSVSVVHIFAEATAKYKTPNKGHLFVESTFANDAVKPVLITPEDGKSQEITLPADIKKLVLGLYLADEIACSVKSVGNAPVLGTPGDYSKPCRYLVENENDRPGKGKRQRLYEIRVQLLPVGGI